MHPDSKTVWRYIRYQVPGLLLISAVLMLVYQFVAYPLWIAFTIWGLWLVKDIVLFPFTWKAYIRDERDKLVGKTGRVVQTFRDGHGRVLVDGEYWKALAHTEEKIEKGQSVIVEEMQGLYLVVTAVDDA